MSEEETSKRTDTVATWTLLSFHIVRSDMHPYLDFPHVGHGDALEIITLLIFTDMNH